MLFISKAIELIVDGERMGDENVLQAGIKEEALTSSYRVVRVDRDMAGEADAEVCVEDSINLLVNGIKVASLTITLADLEPFALGYLICEGLVRSPEEVKKIEVEYPNINVTVDTFNNDDAHLWMEIRSSGCVGVRAAWADIDEPLRSEVRVDKDVIFHGLSLVNDLAGLWKNTGGTHCSIIFDASGGLVSYAEDIGRHNSIDKAIGKALMSGRKLNDCFLVCTGRMPAGMVAKAYRAGIPIVVSNTAPFTTGIDLARRLGMTLVCFARPPRMFIYSKPERITGIK